MFIVWGTYTPKKQLGYVADYCPTCAQAQTFRLTEHRQVGHVYFIPLGRGSPQGHTAACQVCRQEIGVDRSRYRRVTAEPMGSIESLVDETHPDLPEKIAEELDRQEKLASGTADSATRQHALLTGVLRQGEALLQARKATAHFDLPTVLTFLGLTGACLLTCVVAYQMFNASHETMMVLIFGGVGAVIIPTFAVAAFDVTRFYKRAVRPDLVSGIAALKCNAADLDAAVDAMRFRHWLLPKYTDPQDLLTRAEGRMVE